MSPLSSRLSSPLRASSCDIGGGVSYSQRKEEEEEEKEEEERRLFSHDHHSVGKIQVKLVFACYLGISAVCFWEHSKRVDGCSSCNETWWNLGISETRGRGAREVVLLCKYVPGDGV